MKKILFATLILISNVLIAQNEKTLLWEISGNGLTKKSYLYGTMHVNEKISYHLSDAFYKHLLEADIVSNESNPETWTDLYELMGNKNLYKAEKFYTDFYLKPITKENIMPLFFNSNLYYNMSSGNNEANADFQENTVLDMFIHQTGKKYNKKIIGLEDAKQSFVNIMKMQNDYEEPKEENRAAILKILKNRPYLQAMNDYYREKDVLMLDSLYKLIYPKKNHDILIIDRNITMTKSIDSLCKTGSMFAAVGAAHLAGKQGIIELLKVKGYTVKPVFDELTAAGEKQKKTIEEFFPSPTFVNYQSADEMIKMPLFEANRTTDELTSALDFANGGSINIKRIPLNYFLNKKETSFNPKIIDSLFFENIAGNIIEKKYFESQNYKGYDIKNKTKAGNFQHYKFYITPLEIVAVSLTGTGEYAKKFENEIFDAIEIKKYSNQWQKITPNKGGFSVEVPSFNAVYGNQVDENSDIQIQAYNEENEYYFLTEKTFSDNDVLENTGFEHKQIQAEFYMDNEMEMLTENFDKSNTINESSSEIENKKVNLKTVIVGVKYYLLGTVNASVENTNRFFKSFATQNFNYPTETKTLNDTVSKFKIDLPEKQNQRLFLDIDSFKDKSKNTFLSKYKTYTFQSNSGKKVNLEYNKYHKYEFVENLDSLKTSIYKNYIKDYYNSYANHQEDYDDSYDDDYTAGSNNVSMLNYLFNSKKGFSPSQWGKLMTDENDKYQFVSQQHTFNKENNNHVFEAIVSKPNSSQAIKYKTVIQQDSYYELTTVVEKEYKNNDPFIEKTFASLKPVGQNEYSLFDDKLQLFIKDVYSEKDTIRFSAIESVDELKIKDSDFETITQFLDNFKFKDSETEAISSLLLKIGSLKDARVVTYLENKYKDENTKTIVQLAVLKALAKQKSKIGYKKIMDLLEYDLPITDKQYDVTSLFNLFEFDLENSKELFPDIFQFYSIKEYNEPIISLCNSLLDKKLVSAKKINSFKKIILTNAKLEYKRVVSWKEINVKPIEETDDKETGDALEEVAVAINEEYTNEESAPVTDLINYINLLYNFESDSDIQNLITKIEKLDIEDVNMELIRLGIVNDKITKPQIEKGLAVQKFQFPIIQLLLNKDKFNIVSTITDDQIAEAALRNFETINKKDTLTFIEKRVAIKNEKPVTYYFYKITIHPKKDELPKQKLFAVGFVNDKTKINPRAYSLIDEQTIEEDDDISKKINVIIKKSINDNHFRATFEKQKEENNFYNMYGGY